VSPGWAGEFLVTLGVLVLLFAAWQLWWTDVVSNRAQTQVVDSLEATFARQGAEATSAPVPANGIPEELNDDGAFAVLRIPRFGEHDARPIIEGTGRGVLALARDRVPQRRRGDRPRPLGCRCRGPSGTRLA